MAHNNFLLDYYKFVQSLLIAQKSIKDTRFINENVIECNQIVDCSEVIKYCFPAIKSRKTGFSNIGSKHVPNILFRERLILDKLFNSKNKLIILPPHAEELMNFYNDKKNHLVSNRNSLEEISTLFNQDEFQNILKTITSLKRKKKPITGDDLNMIVDFLKNNFNILKSLESLESILGIKKFESLVKSKSIMTLQEYIEFKKLDVDIKEEIDEINKKSVFWYSLLEGNHSYERELLNINDAISLGYIDHLNSRLISKKQLFLFTSRSEFIMNLLFQYGSVKYENKLKDVYSASRRVSVARNYESLYFLERILVDKIHNKENYLNHLIEKLNFKLDKIEPNKINSLRIESDLLSDIKNEITELFEILEHNENIESILLERSTENTNSSGRYKKELVRNKYRKAIKTILSIFDYDKDLIERLKNELEGTDSIDSVISDLNDYFFNIKNIESRKALSEVVSKKEFKKYRATIDFIGVKGEMSARIILHDGEAIKKAKEIFGNKKSKLSLVDKSKDFFLKVKDDNPEMLLIYGYLKAVDESYSDAIDILNLINPSHGDSTYVEASYLKTIIFRKLESVENGIYFCIDVLKNKENEYRVLRELGVFIWLALKKNIKIANYPYLHNNYPGEINIKTSIRITKECLKNSNDEDFLGRCYNSLAYYYADINEVGQAKSYILKISDLSRGRGFEKWPVRFIGTQGYVNYKLSLQKKDKSEKLSLLLKAKEDINKALKSNLLVSYERRITAQNMSAIITEIGRIEEKSP